MCVYIFLSLGKRTKSGDFEAVWKISAIVIDKKMQANEQTWNISQSAVPDDMYSWVLVEFTNDFFKPLTTGKLDRTQLGMHHDLPCQRSV